MSGGTYTFTYTVSQVRAYNLRRYIHLRTSIKDLKSFFRQRECGFKSHPGTNRESIHYRELLPLGCSSVQSCDTIACRMYGSKALSQT